MPNSDNGLVIRHVPMDELHRTARRVFHDNPTAAAKLNLSVLKHHGYKHGGTARTGTKDER